MHYDHSIQSTLTDRIIDDLVPRAAPPRFRLVIPYSTPAPVTTLIFLRMLLGVANLNEQIKYCAFSSSAWRHKLKEFCVNSFSLALRSSKC